MPPALFRPAYGTYAHGQKLAPHISTLIGPNADTKDPYADAKKNPYAHGEIRWKKQILPEDLFSGNRICAMLGYGVR